MHTNSLQPIESNVPNNSKRVIVQCAVLFDLDGTLIDTAPAFIHIIHQLAQQYAFLVPSDKDIRNQVSEGARAMVQLLYQRMIGVDSAVALNKDAQLIDQNYPSIDALKQQFLDQYKQNISHNTTVFEDVIPVLEQLEKQNIPWGIVTNKPRVFTEQLLEALNLTTRCAVLVCPDDVTHTKPHPEPMYKAAQLLNIAPEYIAYVGDHPRDIEAGNNANMYTILAAYGYLPPQSQDNLASWGANAIIASPKDLQSVLNTWMAHINSPNISALPPATPI